MDAGSIPTSASSINRCRNIGLKCASHFGSQAVFISIPANARLKTAQSVTLRWQFQLQRVLDSEVLNLHPPLGSKRMPEMRELVKQVKLGTPDYCG